MSEVNLIEMYGKFGNNTYLEHISLSKYDSIEEIEEQLKKNYDNLRQRANIRKKKLKFSIIYHRIPMNRHKIEVSTLYDGFYEVIGSRERKYYLTFKKMTDFVHNSQGLVTKFSVLKGYTKNKGGNLK